MLVFLSNILKHIKNLVSDNPDPFEITIVDHDGNILKSPPFHTHYTAAANTCVSEYYPNYKEAFDYAGAVTYSKLGNALILPVLQKQ